MHAWSELHDGDVQEAFFDAAINYAEDANDFVILMTEKVNELFQIAIDDNNDI